MSEDEIPNIVLAFNETKGENYDSLRQIIVQRTLKRILPKENLGFNSFLPFVTSTIEQGNVDISFYALCKLRHNAFKFFFEMVSRWLIPGRRLNVTLLHAVDFRLPEINEETYTLCELIVRVEQQADREKIARNLPTIESEIRLGLQSTYHANRILEIRGCTFDEKVAQIQMHIAHLIQRLPKQFGEDLLNEMQHVLINCSDHYKNQRGSHHLCRIISVMYLFRKRLSRLIERFSESRHLSLKIFRIELQGGEKKKVLGVIVGVNFLRDKEIFEKRHLAKAVQNYVPTARAIDSSFLSIRRGGESICTLYLEFEKSDSSSFTKHEMQLLRRDLPIDLKGRIQHLMHPIFMPRNEEEIMRNILSLSSQIRYVGDVPQVMITFDRQTHSHLFFTVIVVQVLKPGSDTLQQIFEKNGGEVNYVHDRCKTIGYLRKKYSKEASVFSLKAPAESFFRRDQSIDLSKARQYVTAHIYKTLGEFRDFNGGMITKQQELLEQVRKLLGKSIKYNDLVLENLFYSLYPEVMRTVLEADALKTLFQMQVTALENLLDRNRDIPMILRFDDRYVYAMVTAINPSIKENLDEVLASFEDTPTSIAKSSVTVYDVPYLGYIYQNKNPMRQKSFIQAVQNVVAKERFILTGV